jgi:hypothetical protein
MAGIRHRVEIAAPQEQVYPHYPDHMKISTGG